MALPFLLYAAVHILDDPTFSHLRTDLMDDPLAGKLMEMFAIAPNKFNNNSMEQCHITIEKN